MKVFENRPKLRYSFSNKETLSCHYTCWFTLPNFDNYNHNNNIKTNFLPLAGNLMMMMMMMIVLMKRRRRKWRRSAYREINNIKKKKMVDEEGDLN